ncbi:MAG: hypothetical protein EOO12_14080 [Chitinophagaceae bacterium]|nr:MAG: hypothetical protein EOO12_14080 [Chitinophagaceae bacterium]
MSNRKDSSGHRGTDGSETRHKGESRASQQTGAPGVGKQDTGRHRKDESEGARRNTTEKGPNSI